MQSCDHAAALVNSQGSTSLCCTLSCTVVPEPWCLAHEQRFAGLNKID